MANGGHLSLPGNCRLKIREDNLSSSNSSGHASHKTSARAELDNSLTLHQLWVLTQNVRHSYSCIPNRHTRISRVDIPQAICSASTRARKLFNHHC